MTDIPDGVIAKVIKQIGDAIRQFAVHIGAEGFLNGAKDAGREATKKWFGDKFNPKHRLEAVGFILSLDKLVLPNGNSLPLTTAKRSTKKLLKWLNITRQQTQNLTDLNENEAIEAIGRFWNAMEDDPIKADAMLAAALSTTGVSQETITRLEQLSKLLGESGRNYRKLVNENKMRWIFYQMAENFTRNEFLQVLEHLNHDPLEQTLRSVGKKGKAAYIAAKPTISRWKRNLIVIGIALSAISLIALLTVVGFSLASAQEGLSGNGVGSLSGAILTVPAVILFLLFAGPLIGVGYLVAKTTGTIEAIKKYASTAAVWGVGITTAVLYMMLAGLHQKPETIPVAMAAGIILISALVGWTLTKKRWWTGAIAVSAIILLVLPAVAWSDKIPRPTKKEVTSTSEVSSTSEAQVQNTSEVAEPKIKVASSNSCSWQGSELVCPIVLMPGESWSVRPGQYFRGKAWKYFAEPDGTVTTVVNGGEEVFEDKKDDPDYEVSVKIRTIEYQVSSDAPGPVTFEWRAWRS